MPYIGGSRSKPRVMIPILLFFIAHWYLSLFSQTFFLHRYAAHNMFEMSKGWERFFFLFSCITQGSSYLSPNTYGVLHRLHHAHVDTPLDPHSPSYDRNFFSMMWRTRQFFADIFYGRADIDPKYLKDLPEWRTFDWYANKWYVRGAFGLGYVAFYITFATAWWQYLLLPAHFLMGPLHGVIINWFAHKYGYRNFDTNDTSVNLMPVDIFMLGEGFHNNHHRHGHRANFGVKWFELDPVYPFIWAFDKLGMIRLKVG